MVVLDDARFQHVLSVKTSPELTFRSRALNSTVNTAWLGGTTDWQETGTLVLRGLYILPEKPALLHRVLLAVISASRWGRWLAMWTRLLDSKHGGGIVERHR